jgi:putative oxidoreductase
MQATLLSWAPRILSILRIISGLLFLEHGSQKLLHFPPRPMPPPGAPPMGGMGPPEGLQALLMGSSGYFELIGGVLLVFGLFTRPVAFVLSGMMAVAYFMVHAPMNFFPILNMGEGAILYCFVFLYFVFAGGGPWSVDAMMAKRRAEAAAG